jgi:SAM-dependent methyltransferase
VIPLSDRQLDDLQQALAWETGFRLPDGRVLGVAGKRGAVSEGRDFRVQLLADRGVLAGKRVLELGCAEGIHTVQLGELAEEVVAVEVRPKNIACALVRLFVHEVENARLVLEDVRDVDDGFGSFDVVFHVGVLYHLPDPVEHLFRISGMADVLLLDTHYETDATKRPRADLTREGKSYQAYLYREGGWRDAFSGVEDTSRWLERESLLELVQDVGFDQVEIVSDRIERNGSRITMLATRSS